MRDLERRLSQIEAQVGGETDWLRAALVDINRIESLGLPGSLRWMATASLEEKRLHYEKLRSDAEREGRDTSWIPDFSK